MVVYCYIIIYAMLCYSYFTFILTVDALQRLEELRRFAESQAYVSQMQLAASCWSRCLVVYHWILYSDAYNAHDTDDTYYDHCHPCEILWTWFGLDAFSAFPALFSVLHVYPRRHACWDLRASWLPLAALATAWSKGCVKYFADLRSFIWVQTQTMQQFAVIGTLKPKAMVPQNDKWCQSAT